MDDDLGISPKCESEMKKVLSGNRKAFGIFLTADLLVCFGLISVIVIPGAGWFAGVVFILIGISLRYKIQKGLKCLKCRLVVPEFRSR